MAFNCDHSRLLVGNACGHILEYDMKDGKLVRTLNDVHPPEAAILHLKVIFFFPIYKINSHHSNVHFFHISLQICLLLLFCAIVEVVFLNLVLRGLWELEALTPDAYFREAEAKSAL